MKILFPLVVVLALALVGYAGATNGLALKVVGIAVPYAALAIFLAGMVWRMVRWARSPVPFPITTTGGQQKSLPWIRHSKLDNPFCTLGTIGRMALEVLFFRSLFRNTKADVRDGKVGYGSAKWLWVAGLAFHWTMLLILLRHLRFFLAPIPGFVSFLESADGLFQIGVPVLYLTDVVFLVAVTYLFLRRVIVPQVS